MCAVSIASDRATAQRVSSAIDVGAASMRYADSVNAVAVSASPALRVNWSRATLGASGMYAQLGSGRWSTQGLLGASAFTPTVYRLSGELAASTGGSAHWDGSRTGETVALARVHFDQVRAGLWAGGGIGRMWDGSAWHPVGLGEFGLWARAANATLVATAAPTVTDDTIRYVDSELTAHYENSYVALDAIAGFRGGRQLTEFGDRSRGWGGAALTAWLTAHVGLVVSAGTYPVDLTQGFPGGRYFVVSLRVAPARAPSAFTVLTPLDAMSDPATGSATVSLVMQKTPSGDWELRVRAPGAGRVELNADFTGWQPVSLTTLSNGWWTLTLPLASGTHQLNVRVDGGAWVVPAGLLALSEEFGGQVGLLVVP